VASSSQLSGTRRDGMEANMKTPAIDPPSSVVDGS
jgi:hypothetical protein